MRKILGTSLSAVLVAALLGVPSATGAETVPTTAATEATPAETADSVLNNTGQTEELLRVVDEIPEEVLAEGDAATRAWLEERQGTQVQAAGFLGCSGAILATIGTTVFPAAKLLKIKRYMNALGGTTEAIRILWGASFSYEKLQAVGGAAAALGAELLGITAIREACTD